MLPSSSVTTAYVPRGSWNCSWLLCRSWIFCLPMDHPWVSEDDSRPARQPVARARRNKYLPWKTPKPHFVAFFVLIGVAFSFISEIWALLKLSGNRDAMLSISCTVLECAKTRNTETNPLKRNSETKQNKLPKPPAKRNRKSTETTETNGGFRRFNVFNPRHPQLYRLLVTG